MTTDRSPLDPYRVSAWRRRLGGLTHARCSLAPPHPPERLLQGEPADLLALRADSLGRAASTTGTAVTLDGAPDGQARSLIEAHGVSVVATGDGPALGPWGDGSPPGVRSVQRLTVPPGRDAAWLCDAYLGWVDRLPMVGVRARPDRVDFLLGGVSILTFTPRIRGPSRTQLTLVGGRLARNSAGVPGSLEVRLLPDGVHALIGVHDYLPTLPWPAYRATQAVLHPLVVAGFAASLEPTVAAPST